MRIAVTGATGFIGRHVITELSQYSVDIVAVVRHKEKAQFDRIDLELVELDLRHPPEFSFEALGCPDVLIHLAWGGLPNYYSLHHFEEELPQQYLFLSRLIRCGLKSLVVAGTCSEYGMQSGQLKETRAACPNNTYSYAKNALRCQLEFLQTVHPFGLTWARIFYMYGDRQAPTSLLSQLKIAVQNGDEIFNMSGGEQLRDYLPVTEIAKILVNFSLKKINGGIINVCSGKPISIRRLVEGWIEENNWKIQLNLGYYPYSEREPMAFWGDRKKLNSVLELE